MAMKPLRLQLRRLLSHWINVGAKLKTPPQIFHVNWFRQDNAGKYLWPGYGENLRVLRWIIDRCKGKAAARDTAIGICPIRRFGFTGLQISPARSRNYWRSIRTLREEFAGIGKYLAEFADAYRKHSKRAEERGAAGHSSQV